MPERTLVAAVAVIAALLHSVDIRVIYLTELRCHHGVLSVHRHGCCIRILDIRRLLRLLVCILSDSDSFHELDFVLRLDSLLDRLLALNSVLLHRFTLPGLASFGGF